MLDSLLYIFQDHRTKHEDFELYQMLKLYKIYLMNLFTTEIFFWHYPMKMCEQEFTKKNISMSEVTPTV